MWVARLFQRLMIVIPRNTRKRNTDNFILEQLEDLFLEKLTNQFPRKQKSARNESAALVLIDIIMSNTRLRYVPFVEKRTMKIKMEINISASRA